jgi:hypothetical protein
VQQLAARAPAAAARAVRHGGNDSSRSGGAEADAGAVHQGAAATRTLSRFSRLRHAPRGWRVRHAASPTDTLPHWLQLLDSSDDIFLIGNGASRRLSKLLCATRCLLCACVSLTVAHARTQAT